MPVLGICNGFQILCEAGLLPGALIRNRSLRFVCRRRWTAGRDLADAVSRGADAGRGRSRSRSSTARASSSRPPDELDRIERDGLVVVPVLRAGRRDRRARTTPTARTNDDRRACATPRATSSGSCRIRARRRSGRRRHRRSAAVRVAAVVRARAGLGVSWRSRTAPPAARAHRRRARDGSSRPLGREPNRDELAMYAVMWSSTAPTSPRRSTCGTLPTEGPGGARRAGPGRRRGRRRRRRRGRVQDGVALAPQRGRAVPGRGDRGRRDRARHRSRWARARSRCSIRCVFGPLADERNRWLFEGVVAGIGGYGNCIGVPTVGGEMQFADRAHGEPHRQRDVRRRRPGRAARSRPQSRTAHEGSLLVLFGAATGRDGIGGVIGAGVEHRWRRRRRSARPSVQIGDPFAGKLLIEASLELDRTRPARGSAGPGRRRDHVRRERVGRPGPGWAPMLDSGRGPLREPDLEAFEILTSESQERMLAIVAPERLERGPGGLRAVGARDRR